jgi:hypothetical protein
MAKEPFYPSLFFIPLANLINFSYIYIIIKDLITLLILAEMKRKTPRIE